MTAPLPSPPSPPAPPGRPVTGPAAGKADRRRRLIVGLLLAGLAVWAGRAAWADIFHIAWKDEEASQVWLVFPIFAWLVWLRRDAAAAAAARYSLWGPALAAAGLGLSLWGYLNLNQAFWHAGAVLAVVAAFLTVAGVRVLRTLLPALVVLLFLVPVPGMIRQQIAIPLQTATASASAFVFTLLGLDVTRTGNILIYNGQEVAVAEACNGMRMIFALLLVAYAFAFANPLRPWARAAVLAFSPVAAIFCNVLRLVPTVILYGQSPDRWGPMFHDLAGWGMLIVAFGVLTGGVRLLQWAEVPVMQPGHPAADDPDRVTPAAVHAAAAPGGARLAGPLLAAAVLLGFGLHQLRYPTPASAAPYHARVLQLAGDAPKQFGPWQSQDNDIPPSAIELLRPNATVSRRFIDEAGRRSGQFLIVQCRDARDLGGHWPPNCYKSSGYTETGREAVAWTVPGVSDDAGTASGTAGPGTINGVTYRFERESLNGRLTLVVDNFLILPGVGFVPDMAAVRGAGEDPRRRHFGAAQVQVVTPDGLSSEQKTAVFNELIAAHAELLNAIAAPPTLADPAVTGPVAAR